MTAPLPLERYKHPLKYISPPERRKLRNNALKRSFFWIGVGVLSLILMIILSAFGYEPGQTRREGSIIGLALALGVTCAPLYGLLKLMTLKNRMTDIARAQLLKLDPDTFSAIDSRYQYELRQAKSRFLKIFAFSLAGAMILGSLIFLAFAVIKYT